MHLALTCQDDELMNIVEELHVKAFQGTKQESDVMRMDSLQELYLSSNDSSILPADGPDLQPVRFKSNLSKKKRRGRPGTLQCASCRKNKRGKSAPRIREPHRPGVPCEPCRKKGYDAKTCGDRTLGPSGPKETFDTLEKVGSGSIHLDPSLADSVRREDHRTWMQPPDIPRNPSDPIMSRLQLDAEMEQFGHKNP